MNYLLPHSVQLDDRQTDASDTQFAHILPFAGIYQYQRGTIIKAGCNFSV